LTADACLFPYGRGDMISKRINHLGGLGSIHLHAHIAWQGNLNYSVEIFIRLDTAAVQAEVMHKIS
jgi:hypothetical protein